LLHKDAVAKLKDNFSTEIEHKEFEYRMQVEELAKNNAEEIDKLVRELDQVKENYVSISQEKSLVDRKLKELKSSKPPMPPKISSSSVQTTITAKSFSNLRNSYAEFLKKMKADVVQHCKESKERSNIALLEQLRLEKEKLKYTTTA